MYLTTEQYREIYRECYQRWQSADPLEREVAHAMHLALWAFGPEVFNVQEQS